MNPFNIKHLLSRRLISTTNETEIEASTTELDITITIAPVTAATTKVKVNAVEESGSYGVLNFRRRGVKYRILTKGQKDRLIYLLNNVTDRSIETVGKTPVRVIGSPVANCD